MELQKLYSKVRQAIRDYDMIQEGDRIAIGISGGKDSLTLLYALAGLRKFYPKKFDIEAVTVDVGVGNMDFAPIRELCETLDVRYHLVETQIFEIAKQKVDKTLCPLCAKLRKGALNDKALELGCNKIAYAHHKEDVVDTFAMSLLFEGRIHTFSPVTNWDKNGLVLIRPLIYAEEARIKGFATRYALPVVKNLCPQDKNSGREEIRQLLSQIQGQYPETKNRIFSAICNAHMDDW